MGSILNLVVVQEGEKPLEGLTDAEEAGRRLGPKRASKIRRMFDLEKKDDVRKFVVRRVVKEGNKKTKAPKIQRLITALSLQRKRKVRNSKKKKGEESRQAMALYHTKLMDY